MFFHGRKTQFSEKDLAVYMQAIEYCSDAVVVADKEGIIVYANDAVLKVLDLKREEVIGSDLKQWGSSMGEEYYEAMWATLKEDRNPFRGEIRGTRKNGDEYVAYVQIFPVLDEGKNPQGFLGIEQDITSEQAVVRLRARTQDLNIVNEHLAKEKAESEALLQSIGEGVVATDRDGKITFMNQAAQTMLGWGGEEA
jgi:PAS domain S-box-containing protein